MLRRWKQTRQSHLGGSGCGTGGAGVNNGIKSEEVCPRPCTLGLELQRWGGLESVQLHLLTWVTQCCGGRTWIGSYLTD